MCYLFDVLPTLGKLCGIKGPTTSDGLEFSATLADPAKPARSELVFAYKNVQRAIQNDRWKLIRYPQIDRTQLFDLKADPQEIKNLASQPEYAEKVVALTKQLSANLNASGDNAPLQIPHPEPADWTPPAKTKRREQNKTE